MQKAGQRAGQEWAEGQASWDEIRRLDSFVASSAWALLVSSDGTGKSARMAKRLAWEVLDVTSFLEHQSDAPALAFWRKVLGCNADEFIKSPTFLRAFCESAVGVWRAVKAIDAGIAEETR
jgi:hypothetical protein